MRPGLRIAARVERLLDPARQRRERRRLRLEHGDRAAQAGRAPDQRRMARRRRGRDRGGSPRRRASPSSGTASQTSRRPNRETTPHRAARATASANLGAAARRDRDAPDRPVRAACASGDASPIARQNASESRDRPRCWTIAGRASSSLQRLAGGTRPRCRSFHPQHDTAGRARLRRGLPGQVRRARDLVRRAERRRHQPRCRLRRDPGQHHGRLSLRARQHLDRHLLERRQACRRSRPSACTDRSR